VRICSLFLQPFLDDVDTLRQRGVKKTMKTWKEEALTVGMGETLREKMEKALRERMERRVQCVPAELVPTELSRRHRRRWGIPSFAKDDGPRQPNLAGRSSSFWVGCCVWCQGESSKLKCLFHTKAVFELELTLSLRDRVPRDEPLTLV
jgi:hypothetical protein